jgi:hypothetical protein
MFALAVAKAETKPAETPVAQRLRHGAVESAHSFQGTIGNQATSHRASGLTGGEKGWHREHEADRMHMPDQGVASATSWDFSKISIYPRGAAPRPHIEPSAIHLDPLPPDEARGATPGADGSIEDLEEDQDSLVPSVFERKPGKRGVHINVVGGNPAGTPDFPDGIRWIQTIDTNAPLFGLSPPYVDFVPPADDKPFYFSDAMEAAKGGTFSDFPTRKANGVRWDATLSLVGVAGRKVTRLDSVDYGFDLDASGTLTLHGPSTTGVSDIVVQGDTLRSEYPDWFFGGGFAVPQVPAGGVTGGTGTA